MSVTDSSFQCIKTAVLSKRPVLNELITKRGSKSLYDYTKDYISVNLNPPIQKRQDELITTFQAAVAKLLGADIAVKAAKQLEKYYYVSTADHHGPICHPFFVNANLLLVAPYQEINDPALQYVIVLACASISFRNSSFPRGLLFHNSAAANLPLERVAFFPASMRACPVFNWRAYTLSEVDEIKRTVQNKVKAKTLPGDVAEKITQLMDQVYLNPVALAQKTFSDQTTVNNYALWQRFFPANNPAPANLICLEQETLVMQLILNYHLNQDTTIYHILFDSTYDPLMMQYFENVMGAFSVEHHWGSYLFWAMPPGSKYRVQLWKKDNWLVSDDGSYKVELTPTAIRTALEAREIFPTTLLDFIVLSFYYGLKCVGGFNQINYLTDMKNNYIKMQVDRENYKSIEVCARAQTKEMNDGFTLAFLQAQQATYAATGLDFILYGQSDTWQKLVQTIKAITVEEAFYPLLPELYRVIYNEKNRLPQLTNITDADLMEISGVSKKIIPCVTL
jgi:hypothetical protein